MPDSKSPPEPRDSAAGGRLDSWKEIAAYLDRDDRTVRRWEKAEGLPVHRHAHSKRATVYAYEAELDGWLKGRDERKDTGESTSATAVADKRRPIAYGLAIAGAAVLIAIAYLFSMGPAGFGPGKSAAGALIDNTSDVANHDPKYTVLFAEAPRSFSTRQPSFDISPSGRRGVFYADRDGEPGQLHLFEQKGAVIRPLLNDLGPWQEFHYPNWSPSEHLIAYVAARPAEPRADAVEGERNLVSAIFVVSPDGGTPRQIGPAMREIDGLCWTPDGQDLTYLDRDRDGAHTISLDGGGVKTIPMDPTVFAVLGGYSPDGRWLAMKVRTDMHLVGMHSQIQLLSTTDGQVVPLTTVSASHITLTWAPDGNSLYFSSAGGPVRKLNIDPTTGALQGDPEQVTFYSGAYAIYPKFIDGGRIAFLLSTSTRSIHVADASRPTESKTVAAGSLPKLSPDGQVLYHVGSYGSSGGGLYAVPIDGGTPTRLAEWAWNFELSPDGENIAYIRNRDGETSLRTASTRGGEPRLLHKFEGNTEWTRWARWSPDGSLLAYAHGTGLYVIPSDGGTPKKLADMPRWSEYSLRWSPDGESIAAFGYPDGDDRENIPSVYLVPVSGGEPRKILSTSVWVESLEWHPDGQRLTYNDSTHDNGTWQVFLDGRPPSLLVNEPNHWDFHGRWSPDGRRYYFQSPALDNESSEEHSGISVYDEATGDISHIANMGSLPTWSRDGKTMTWVTNKKTHQIMAMSDFH